MPRRMDRSEGERRTAQRFGDQPESEGSRLEERVQSERDSEVCNENTYHTHYHGRLWPVPLH